MCQYMLIIPTLTDVLRGIGVSTGLVGAIAGASDFASMFMTPGATRAPSLLHVDICTLRLTRAVAQPCAHLAQRCDLCSSLLVGCRVSCALILQLL